MREIEKVEHVICDMCKMDAEKLVMSGNSAVPTMGEYLLGVEGTEPDFPVDLCHKCFFILQESIPFLNKILHVQMILTYAAALRR